MWNLYPFYLDLTGVCAPHQSLERLDHFLCGQIDERAGAISESWTGSAG